MRKRARNACGTRFILTGIHPHLQLHDECYKVTSTKFMPREGCDGSDAGDDSSDEDEAVCPFPCPAANDACPALEPLPEDECLPGGELR